MSETQVLMKFYFFGFFSRYHFLEGTLCLNGRGVGGGLHLYVRGPHGGALALMRVGGGSKKSWDGGQLPHAPSPTWETLNNVLKVGFLS